VLGCTRGENIRGGENLAHRFMGVCFLLVRKDFKAQPRRDFLHRQGAEASQMEALGSGLGEDELCGRQRSGFGTPQREDSTFYGCGLPFFIFPGKATLRGELSPDGEQYCQRKH
jgi:hypothetical protein